MTEIDILENEKNAVLNFLFNRYFYGTGITDGYIGLVSVKVRHDGNAHLSIGKYKNFTLNHFIERISIYNKEQFDYKLKKIDFVS